jgi:hypothetical protein
MPERSEFAGLVENAGVGGNRLIVAVPQIVADLPDERRHVVEQAHAGDAGDGVSSLCAARDEPRLAIPALDLRAIESSPLLMSSPVRTIGVDVPPSTPPSEVLELQDAP